MGLYRKSGDYLKSCNEPTIQNMIFALHPGPKEPGFSVLVIKPSLCIDARMWRSSGIGTYLRHLIPFIIKRPEWDVTLLLKAGDTFEGVPSITVDAQPYTLQEQVLLPRKIPPCDLFWSPHYNVPLLKSCAKKRAVTIHDVCHIAEKKYFPVLKRWGAHLLLSEALRKSDLVLTVSSFSKQEIFRYFPNTKNVHVVSPAAPPKITKFLPSLESLGITAPYILYVGNIKPHKNIQRLLAACENLHVPLVLAGKVSMPLPASRVLIKEDLSDAEIATLYSHAELLIQPSLYEGFGLTPLEAMTYGCPVVASNTPSLKEVCGEAAEYVDPLSVASIRRGIEKVLKQEEHKKALIEKGHERILQFSSDETGKKIVDLFLQELFP